MTRLSIFCVIVLSFPCFREVQARRGFGTGDQEWGFAEVRPGAHMFWWLHYTLNQNITSHHEKPLVIWLQGGPGTSATGYSNFKQIGPYDEHLRPRNISWVHDYNVLFIDSPVGTGFSYLKDGASYSKTNYEIASDLLQCIRAFYTKLPEFRATPVYIMSASYGAKMAAEFALLWYKIQETGLMDSRLKGIGLGDPWISPIDNVLSWAPYLLNLGMIYEDEHERIAAMADQAKQLVEQERWPEAFRQTGYTMGEIALVTGDFDPSNVLVRRRADEEKGTMPVDPVLDELMNKDVREFLELSERWRLQNMDVYQALGDDFMRPVTDVVEQLLDSTTLRVFVYNSQLDVITTIPATLKWINNLKSEQIEIWKDETRVPLTIDGLIEGFKKCSKRFSFYWIQRAGLNVLVDNPAAALAILKDLTQ